MIPLELSGSVVAGIATVLAALVAGFFAWLAVRGNERIKRIEAEAEKQRARDSAREAERSSALSDRQASYDQLQEDVAGLRKEMADVKQAHLEQDQLRGQEIADVRRDLARSQRRERILESHAWALHRFIETGSNPPPPRWPEKELREIEG